MLMGGQSWKNCKEISPATTSSPTPESNTQETPYTPVSN